MRNALSSLSFFSALTAVALVALPGCAVSTGADGAGGGEGAGDPEDEAALTAADAEGWSKLGTGVSFKAINEGANVLITYAGYSGTDSASKGWASALVAARLADKGVGQVYAVKGPQDAGYNAKEISNSKIVARLMAENTAAESIVIVAHSSGGFVANELFSQLQRKAPDLIGKISYFDLDGATPSSSLQFHKLAFVSAKDRRTGTNSHNASIMASAASDRGVPHKVIDASQAGCHAGASWCVHDAMITSKCHNPDRFDLQRDYTDFDNGREVISSYFDVLD